MLKTTSHDQKIEGDTPGAIINYNYNVEHEPRSPTVEANVKECDRPKKG